METSHSCLAAYISVTPSILALLYYLNHLFSFWVRWAGPVDEEHWICNHGHLGSSPPSSIYKPVALYSLVSQSVKWDQDSAYLMGFL